MPEPSIHLSSYDIETKVESFHWWFVVRRKLLGLFLSFLSLPHECVVLDIGCGTGSNLKILGMTGRTVIGLDRSFYALSLARKKTNFPLLNGDLSKLPIRPESVGLIVAMDILEHLDDDATGIRSFHQALKQQGVLIITVPAFGFLWGTQDEVTGHKRRYSRQEIVNKLRRGGFEIMKSSYFNFFLFFPIFVARRLIHLVGLRIESENEINFPIINFFLKAIFSLESYALRWCSFPFGVSIFCIAKKSETIRCK